jgi:hypothetical protein
VGVDGLEVAAEDWEGCYEVLEGRAVESWDTAAAGEGASDWVGRRETGEPSCGVVRRAIEAEMDGGDVGVEVLGVRRRGSETAGD